MKVILNVLSIPLFLVAAIVAAIWMTCGYGYAAVSELISLCIATNEVNDKVVDMQQDSEGDFMVQNSRL
jgi:hypothetical protein